ncbi:hypothetical protein AB0I53_38550 [Saccharopolyspora sp. NPDC050389]|uniref:hypothetical protein n=1 Tax=Saccharopolyspora sp. NPDC050389 TaxID=3155516 RepID=UPI00340B53E7
MTDHSGGVLRVAVAMDYPAFVEAENRIGGLPALIRSDSGGCDVHTVYQGGGTESTPRTVRVRGGRLRAAGQGQAATHLTPSKTVCAL